MSLRKDIYLCSGFVILNLGGNEWAGWCLVGLAAMYAIFGD